MRRRIIYEQEKQWSKHLSSLDLEMSHAGSSSSGPNVALLKVTAKTDTSV